MGSSPRKRAYFSEDFKRSLVSRIDRGELSIREARRQYQIGGSMTIYRWLSDYGSERISDGGSTTSKPMKEVPSPKSQEQLLAEAQELKRLLDLERLRSEAYLEMIRQAEERYGIPIEKKFGAKQSQR